MSSQFLKSSFLRNLPSCLLLSMMLSGLEHPFGLLGSAVPALSPPNILCTPSLPDGEVFSIFIGDKESGIECTLGKLAVTPGCVVCDKANDTSCVTCCREGMPSKGTWTGLRHGPRGVINSFFVPIQNLEDSGRGTSIPLPGHSHRNSQSAHCLEMAGIAEAYTQDQDENKWKT
ncbi:hypothetical protein WISP_84016 [Willisornis vidua]|uniref:Uncharacterized protein n=1 Tax=Willisornis vidua TaxID=1566151 RepID=A0ABQ9D4W9_9PASS|nr:hypothetical protein WISP_84016 [Willisornis vidua]